MSLADLFLKDKEVLPYFAAKNDDGTGVRKAAVTNIEDRKVLLDIAKNDENYWVRKAAKEKLKKLKKSKKRN